MSRNLNYHASYKQSYAQDNYLQFAKKSLLKEIIKKHDLGITF